MFSLLAAFGGFFLLLGYIGQSNSFPKPLEKEEELAYIKRLSAGDEDAREQLIIHNLRLVAHIAKKFVGNGRDLDDLISIGTIGLVKAIDSFRPDKGALSGYASKCVENEILMSLRSERRRVSEVSIEESVGIDKEGNPLALADLIGTDAETIFDSVNKSLDAEKLRDAMERVLSKREQTVLTLRYGVGRDCALAQREVAELMGISRSYVSRIETRAMEKLLTELLPYRS